MVIKHHRSIKGLASSFILLAYVVTGYAFTKNASEYTTDGTQADVVAAIADAVAGDIVNVPSGTFTWGAGGTAVSLNKPITLSGAGKGLTMINLSPTGAAYSGGVIRINAAGTVRNMTINGANSGHVAAFSCGTTNGWRITGIGFNGGTDEAYFAYVGTYGLIDNCTISGGNAQSELIFGRGPSNSWQTASSMGTANAVYIEDCTFGGSGYVCDANSNARFVVRFCTITGTMKVDGHGKASNTPARSVRHMEVYGNRWTNTNLNWAAMELRGGTGMIFNNLCDGSGLQTWVILKEYGCESLWPNFGSIYQTPVNYPIDDQIGVGMDPKSSGSEPMYLWNNRAGGTSSTNWPLNFFTSLTGAIALYRTQTGNPSASFTMQDIISADREYFLGAVGSSFNGSSGIGRGTKSQMLAITPTKRGVGFWVTDEGDWNRNNPGPDGRLYAWNGSAWVLKYTPYVYPYSLPKPASPGNLRPE